MTYGNTHTHIYTYIHTHPNIHTQIHIHTYIHTQTISEKVNELLAAAAKDEIEVEGPPVVCQVVYVCMRVRARARIG